VIRAAALSYPLMGLRRSFPTANAFDVRIARVRSHPLFAPDAAGAATPSLQRIDGADALLHPTGFEARAGLGSLSEVLHRP